MRSSFGISRLLPVVLTAGLLLVASTASAGPEEAREFFKQAKTAYEKGDYARAAKLLEKAYSEEANLTYQYNRIRALQGAEKYREALDVLKTYEKPMLDAKGFEDVPALKQQLREKVGTTSPDDDAPTDSSVSGPADSMEEPDEEQSSNGEAVGSEPSDGAPPKRRDTPTMTYVGWSLTGTGVALLGTGTLYASSLLLPGETRKRVQNDRPLTDRDNQIIKRQQTLSIVFLSLGTGALIGGGVILINQMNQNDRRSSAAATRRPLRIVPWASRKGGGARLEIRF